jgi:hypothetical protein
VDNNEISLAVLKAEADAIRRDGMWPGFRWPDEFKNKVRALHKEGVSAGDIAAETRITIDSVKAWTAMSSFRPKKKKAFIEVPMKERLTNGVSILLNNGKRVEGLKLEDIRELFLSGVL